MRRSSGFGFLGLVIVAAIVLLLAARAWRAQTPAGVAPGPNGGVVGEKLDRMEQSTGEHASELEKALEGP